MTFHNHLAGREAYRKQREVTPDAAIKQQFADRRLLITRPNQPAEDAARVAELVGEYRRQPPVFVSGKQDTEGDMLATYFAGTPEEKAAAEAWLNDPNRIDPNRPGVITIVSPDTIRHIETNTGEEDELPFGVWETMPDPAPVEAVEPCYAIPFTAEDVSLLWDTEDDDAPFTVRPE